MIAADLVHGLGFGRLVIAAITPRTSAAMPITIRISSGGLKKTIGRRTVTSFLNFFNPTLAENAAAGVT